MMTLIEQKIREFETRPATFDSAEQTRRVSMFQHLSAINKFEGLTPSAIDERLFQLLAAGKVSKQEYLELCLTDTCGTA
jgi:hypothetical protein